MLFNSIIIKVVKISDGATAAYAMVLIVGSCLGVDDVILESMCERLPLVPQTLVCKRRTMILQFLSGILAVQFLTSLPFYIENSQKKIIAIIIKILRVSRFFLVLKLAFLTLYDTSPTSKYLCFI